MDKPLPADSAVGPLSWRRQRRRRHGLGAAYGGTSPVTALPNDAVSAGGVLELLATPRAPGEARRHVHRLLSGNGCTAEDLGVAVLLASELVTNAVRHGAAPIVLRLRLWGDSVRVEVRDAGTAFRLAPPGSWEMAAEGGRGLSLVQALATSWGSTVHDDVPIGKTVWFEICQTGGAALTARAFLGQAGRSPARRCIGRHPIRPQLRLHPGRLRVDVGDGGPQFALISAGSWSPTGEGGRSRSWARSRSAVG